MMYYVVAAGRLRNSVESLSLSLPGNLVMMALLYTESEQWECGREEILHSE